MATSDNPESSFVRKLADEFGASNSYVRDLVALVSSDTRKWSPGDSKN